MRIAMIAFGLVFGVHYSCTTLRVVTSRLGESCNRALISRFGESSNLQMQRDWPMWGGSLSRNMVNLREKLAIDFHPLDDPDNGVKRRKVLWVARLGSQTYGNPVVAGGKVFVGTNNGAVYRPKQTGDQGCVLAFDAKTGKFLWQLTRAKLAQGRVNDWPEQGICSAPCVEGDRMWVVTNRAELMCLDTEGFHDRQNDGVQNEENREPRDADIVWSLDMMEQLGVFPHNLATSSPLVYGDLVYLVTSNGVNESHKTVVSPRAPSFIAVHKKTGKVVWESRAPEDRILHGQWSSPTIGLVNGQAQVFFPGGDGWLYALRGDNGKLIWKFDLNPKNSRWLLYGRGTRNNILSTPVFYENSVVVAVGQDPDHSYGVGHLYRIDATKTGDVSPTLIVDASGEPVELERGEPFNRLKGHREIKNPRSAMIWHYGGLDKDGSITGETDQPIFQRTMSTVAIHDGLVYAPDLTGVLHCLDFKTGRRRWVHDALSEIWGSPMVVDGKVLLGDSDGGVRIFAASDTLKELRYVDFRSSVYSTPVIANGVLYIATRSKLFAIQAGLNSQ